MVYIVCIVYQNHYEDRSQDVVGPWSHGDCRKGKPNNDLYTSTFCSMGTEGELLNNCNGGSYYLFHGHALYNTIAYFLKEDDITNFVLSQSR